MLTRNGVLSVFAAAVVAAGAAPVAADATTVVLHRSYVHSAVKFEGAILAPEGPSRTLTVSDGADSVTVQEWVSPSIWMGVTSRPGGRLTFYGGVLAAGAPLPPVVVLQDRTPLGWRTMGVATVGPHGGFRDVYRAPASLSGYAFQFRAATLQTGVWQPGASKVHEAVVRR